MERIPAVDLEDFFTPARRSRFVDTVGRSLEEIGFFAVENHGISTGLVRQAYQCAVEFFELPVETKQQYELAELKGQRGYTSLCREHAKSSSLPDLKEFYQIGREPEEDEAFHSLYGGNVWPRECPDFGPVLSRLYESLENLAADLLDACSLYLGEEGDLLRQMTWQGDSILRLIHYPPIPADAPPGSMRSAEHEDINLITLLCGSTAEGLEVLDRDGTWRAIDAGHEQIIVDSGDMLQNLTNGLFKSTTHRVTNPDNRNESRLSMPFFTHPRREVDLTPLPGCVTRTGGTRYPSITAGEYLEERLREIGLGT